MRRERQRLHNRVTPFGEVVAIPQRGLYIGNRGIIHDPVTKTLLGRRWTTKAWLVCVLDYKGRGRELMGGRSWTELFFLDEATALAAGHRPCAECQRERFNLFRTTFALTNSDMLGTRPVAPLIDEVLHHERRSPEGKKRTYKWALNELPNGAFVTLDDESEAYLVLEKALLRWSPFGYENIIRRPSYSSVNVLTPPSIVRILGAGYQAGIHQSAFK